jgi:aryl-alcohol dehydrogenase-like predicted oxidoreductase
LEEMQRQVDAGRVRHFGLSNESAWGIANWLQIAQENGLPRVQSVQNEYSLLCRYFDTDLAELSHNEDVGLLAFSPLAAGLLSGKYTPDHTPDGSRRQNTPDLGGRISPRVWAAIDAYQDIANRHNLDPCQMALAWCATRPFMTSVIFGATNMAQLETALGAQDFQLSPDVMDEIAVAHKAHPMPY